MLVSVASFKPCENDSEWTACAYESNDDGNPLSHNSRTKHH